jgi:hypothetical protein
MSKKQKVSVMDFEAFQFNDTPQGDLPSIEAVEESIAKVTNKPKKEIEKEKMIVPVEKPKVEKVVEKMIVQKQKVEIIQSARWFKPEAVGREKLTTYLKGDLIETLKIMALKKKITLADLIEKILLDNYEKY